MLEVNLEKGWMVFQDIHCHGEKVGVPDSGFDNTELIHSVSEYESIPALKHLQTILWDTPYYGLGLRQFNMAPWWYRNTFKTPENAPDKAVLVFEGVDYFAKVWLNGKYLGEHENYFGCFEFDISAVLNPGAGAENTIHVLVSSPWDDEPVFEKGTGRFWAIERRLMKGTYEHDDTFVQRDVNPVGICAPVKVFFFDTARISAVNVKTKLEGENSLVELETIINGDAGMDVSWSIIDMKTGVVVLSKKGKQGKEILKIENPKLWQPWDQGEPACYLLRTSLKKGEQILDVNEKQIGFRTAEFRRTPDETSFILNGRKIFIRGCTYFPDNYVSLMSEGRYRRDLANIKAAGFNAVRIHVHIEQDIFYDLCDELGIIVFQDTDLNWAQERSAEFIKRAEKMFAELTNKLSSHPAIGAWICYNEPDGKEDGYFMTTGPAPQIAALARALTPGIPYITGSWCDKDPESGDTHNYLGSLNGENTHYLDTEKKIEKFNTEFGFDAPPFIESLLRNRAILDRLNPGVDEIKAIQYYQYRLLKFYIENYRSLKYSPCAGYFQFMFIDLCPQSFYGVYDYYGVEKEGVKALLESNLPIAVILKEKDKSYILYAVNDTLCSWSGCTTEVIVLNNENRILFERSCRLDIPADSIVNIGELNDILKIRDEVKEIKLYLKSGTGEELAHNRYEKPFEHPPHPKGHPRRMSHELGMRLFNF